MASLESTYEEIIWYLIDLLEDKKEFERGCYGREDSSEPLTVEIRVLVNNKLAHIGDAKRCAV